MTLLMNKWTNIFLDDGWVPSVGQNPTFPCWLLFSWFHLHPKGNLIEKQKDAAEEKVDKAE